MLERRVKAAALALTAVIVAFSGAERAARADIGLMLPPVSDEALRGVRFGEFILIPLVSLETRYNTNVFRQDPTNEGSTPATILTVRPGFRLSNPQPSTVRLTWEGNVGYSQYFSPVEAAKAQGRVTAGTGLRADFLPKSVVGFFVAENFTRNTMPRNYSTSDNFDRNDNHVEAGLQFRPGGGALEISASYAFNFSLFDQYTAGNLLFHEARVLTTWDFFPKTTFLLDADFRVMDWLQQQPGFRTDSTPLRVVAGVKGYLTKKVAFLVKGGYGGGFYKVGEDIQTGIGEASLGFKPTPFTTLEFGYIRDFSDSYYANFYLQDGVFLKFGQQIARRVNLELYGKYARISYAHFDPKTLPVNTTEVATSLDRRDNGVNASVAISWSIARWVALRVGYQFDAIITDFKLTNPTTKTSDWGGYLVHQVYGEISLLY